MAIAEKTKSVMEWLEHGKTSVEIIVAVGGEQGSGGRVKAVHENPTNMDNSPLVVIPWRYYGLAIIVFVVNRRWTPSVGQERIAPPPSTGAAQIVASAALTPPTPSPIDVTAFFQQSYSGQLQTEVEGNVRAMISSRLPKERDEFVVKLIATGLINVVYDKIWLVIFRRQVLALTELNHRVLRREQNQNLLRRGGAEVSRCVCELFI